MNLDVVELAQAILKLFKRTPISLVRLCMLKQIFEKLDAVAEFLDRDTQPVAMGRVKLL
jgi:hypothetical protein